MYTRKSQEQLCLILVWELKAQPVTELDRLLKRRIFLLSFAGFSFLKPCGGVSRLPVSSSFSLRSAEGERRG
jgi:hypothetical protein